MCGVATGTEVEGAVEAAGPEEEEPEEVRTEEATQRGPAPRRMPALPSIEEQREHAKTHLPFRSWCKWCVQGRKPNWNHYTLSEQIGRERGPEIHMDYCFFRELEGGESVPCLVVKCRKSRALAAHVVPQKGAGVDWVVSQVMRDLTKWGMRYSETIIIKTGQENAIVDVSQAVASRGAWN